MKPYKIFLVCIILVGSLQAQEADLLQMDEEKSNKKAVKDAVNKAAKDVENETNETVGKVKVKVDVEGSGEMEVMVDFKEPVEKEVQEEVEQNVQDAVDVAVDDTVKTIAAQTEKTPGWKFTAGYAVGYADYTEDPNVLNVNSSWSGWNSTLNFRAQTRLWDIFPYFRIRLLNSEGGIEEWREDGKLIQANDLRIYGGDFSIGFSTQPIDIAFMTLTPQVGLIARFQNFERKNFLLNDGLDSFYPTEGTVNEFVQTYGAGGGFVLDMPVNQSWIFAIDTEVYGLFYSNAKNDGFNVSIDNASGLFWDSSFTLYRKLRNKKHKVGARINSHLQWIEGGTVGSLDEGRLVEWPENRLRNISLECFWQVLY